MTCSIRGRQEKRRPQKSEPLGRLHVKWKNGLDLFAEIKGTVEVDIKLRTISFFGVDGIFMTIPIESMQYWKFAEIIQSTTPDTRLTRPQVNKAVKTRPEAFEWPVDPNY